MTRFNTRTSIQEHVDNGLIVHGTNNSHPDGISNVVLSGDIRHSSDDKMSSTRSMHKYGMGRNDADRSTKTIGVPGDMDPEGSSDRFQVPQTIMTPVMILERQSSQVSDDNDDLSSENVIINNNNNNNNNNNVSINTKQHKVGFKRDVVSTRKTKKKKNFMIEAGGNDGEEQKHQPPTPSTGARPKVSQIINTVRTLGYTDNEVTTALIRLQGGQVDVTYDSLIDMSFDVRMESIQGPAQSGDTAEAVLNNGQNHLHDLTGEEIVGNGTGPEEDAVREHRVKKPALDPEEKYKRRVALALRNKKEELSDAIEALTYKCRVCNDADANILLLPCAHLVCCSNCVDDVRRCPLARCNRIVRGTKEIYYA